MAWAPGKGPLSPAVTERYTLRGTTPLRYQPTRSDLSSYRSPPRPDVRYRPLSSTTGGIAKESASTPAERYRSSLAASAEVGNAAADVLRKSSNTNGSGGITPMSPPPPPPIEKKDSSSGKLLHARDRLLPPAVSPRIPIRSTATNLGRSQLFQTTPPPGGHRSLQPTTLSLQPSALDLKSQTKLPTPRGMRLERDDITTSSASTWDADRKSYQNRVNTLEAEIGLAKEASKRLAAEERIGSKTLNTTRASSAHSLKDARETNSSLQNEVRQLKDEIRTLKNNNYENEKSSSGKLRNEILTLQQKVVASQDKITSLQSELHEERSTTMKLKRESQKQLEENTTLTDLNCALRSKTSKIDELRSECNSKSRQVDDLEEQVKSLREAKARNARSEADLQKVREMLECAEKKEAAIRIEKEQMLSIMETTVAEKEKEICDLREVRVRHEKTNNDNSIRIEDLEHRVAEGALLAVGLSQKESEMLALKDEVDSLRGEKSKIEDQFQRISTDHVSLQESHSLLNEVHQTLESKMSEINKSLDEKDQTIQNLTTSVTEKESMIESLHERLEVFTSGEIASSMEKDHQISQLEANFIDASNQLKAISTEHEETRSKLEEKNHIITCKDDQIEILERKLSTADGFELELVDAKKQLNQAVLDSTRKSEKLASVELELEEYARKVSATTSELHEKDSSLRQQSETITSLEAEVKTHVTELAALTEQLTQIEDLRSKYQQTHSDNDHLRDSLNEKTSKITCLEQEMGELSETLNAANTQLLGLTEKTDQLSNLEQKLQETEDENNNLTATVSSLKQQLQSATDRIADLVKESASQQTLMDEINEKTDQLNTLSKELTDITQQLQDTQRESTEKSERITSLEDSIQTIRTENDNHTDTLRDDCAALNNELRQQTQKADTLQEEVTTLLANKNKDQAEVQELKSRLHEMTDRYEKAKGFNDIRDTEVDQLKEEIRTQEHQIKVIETTHIEQLRLKDEVIRKLQTSAAEGDSESLQNRLLEITLEKEQMETTLMEERIALCEREAKSAAESELIIEDLEQQLQQSKIAIVQEEHRAYRHKQLAEENSDACQRRELRIISLENELESMEFNSKSTVLGLQKEIDTWEGEYMKIRAEKKTSDETIANLEALVQEKTISELEALGKVEILTSQIDHLSAGDPVSIPTTEKDLYFDGLTARLHCAEQELETAMSSVAIISSLEEEMISLKMTLVEEQKTSESIKQKWTASDNDLKSKIARLYISNNSLSMECEEAQRDAVTFATRCGQLEKALMAKDAATCIAPNPPPAPPVRDAFERVERVPRARTPSDDSVTEFGTCASEVNTPAVDTIDVLVGSPSLDSFTALEGQIQQQQQQQQHQQQQQQQLSADDTQRYTSESPSLSLYAESDTVDQPIADYFSIPGTGLHTLCEGTTFRALELLGKAAVE